jgi:hypothetical protein
MPVIGRSEIFGKRCTIMLFWLGPRHPTPVARTEYILFTDHIGCDKGEDRRERQFHGRMHCLFDWFSFLMVVVVCEPVFGATITCCSQLTRRLCLDGCSRLATGQNHPSVQIADGGNVSTVRSTMQMAYNLPTTVSFQLTTFCLDTGN